MVRWGSRAALHLDRHRTIRPFGSTAMSRGAPPALGASSRPRSLETRACLKNPRGQFPTRPPRVGNSSPFSFLLARERARSQEDARAMTQSDPLVAASASLSPPARRRPPFCPFTLSSPWTGKTPRSTRGDQTRKGLIGWHFGHRASIGSGRFQSHVHPRPSTNGTKYHMRISQSSSPCRIRSKTVVDSGKKYLHRSSKHMPRGVAAQASSRHHPSNRSGSTCDFGNSQEPASHFSILRKQIGLLIRCTGAHTHASSLGAAITRPPGRSCSVATRHVVALFFRNGRRRVYKRSLALRYTNYTSLCLDKSRSRGGVDLDYWMTF